MGRVACGGSSGGQPWKSFNCRSDSGGLDFGYATAVIHEGVSGEQSGYE